MRRPSVLHVVERWGSPSETFVADLVTSSTATRPTVVTLRTPPPGTVPTAVRLYDVERWPAWVPPHAAVAAIAASSRADVVHAHFATVANLAHRVARRLRLPLAVSAHGWDVLVGAQRDPGIREGLLAADVVIVPSISLADAVRRLGVRDDVVRVIPSGVDLSQLPWRERRYDGGPVTVTFAGRFVEKKGVLDVARALAQVAGTHEIRATFVGFGPLHQQLAELCRDLQLDAHIVDGTVPGAVRAALASTDLAVTGSRTAADGDAESLGIVNLEAQAVGAPLVTTRHGGVPEAVSENGAILVDPDGDVVAALSGALTQLLDDPERWPAMSRAGRVFVRDRFELGRRVADVDALWVALAAGHRGGQLPPHAARPTAPTPRTSVVLVTHNRRALLQRALDAVGAQTLPPDEVLVVDNGSTDGTADLLAERVRTQQPQGLRVLTRPSNLSVVEGRNLAVAAATGDVVAFTDDDCRPRPTWLEALIAGFTDARVGIVQGRTIGDPAQDLPPLSRSQWTLREAGLYETCNVAYRRSALDAAGPPAPEGPFDRHFAGVVADALGPRWSHLPFGEDAELGWRVRRAGFPTRFATHAVVEHEVYRPDPALLMQRAALAGGFPALVREVPELRRTLLVGGVVLGPRRVRWWGAAAGVAAAAAMRDPRPLLLAAPYAADVIGLRTLTRPGHRRAQLAAVPFLVRRDVAETAALIRGSWRARCVVL